MTAADHTPSPATDGLREAIEALADRLEAPATKMQIISADPAPPIRQVIGAKLRAILAAHPAPPSETAFDRVRIEWGFRFEDGEVRWSRSLTEQQARAMPTSGSEVVRRTVTEFAPIVGEWEPVEETQP